MHVFIYIYPWIYNYVYLYIYIYIHKWLKVKCITLYSQFHLEMKWKIHDSEEFADKSVTHSFTLRDSASKICSNSWLVGADELPNHLPILSLRLSLPWMHFKNHHPVNPIHESQFIFFPNNYYLKSFLFEPFIAHCVQKLFLHPPSRLLWSYKRFLEIFQLSQYGAFIFPP